MGFLCHLCGKEFGTKQNYTRHWTCLHEDHGNHLNGGNSRFNDMKCNYCEKWYKRKENLMKHMVSAHMPDGKEHSMKQCELCDKKVDKGSYKRHLMLKHRPLIGEVDDKPKVSCPMCGVKFNTNSSLSYHKKKVHKIKTNRHNITIKCPLCNYITKGPSRTTMQTHFHNNHNISIDFKSCQFRTLDEFFTWKSEIEKETTSKFIRAKTKSDVIMFKCHRSGRYNAMTFKRNLRTAGSCKINGFCPAFIKAKITNSNDISVTYQLTHVGHKNELRHISLTTEERKAIAILLAKNVPFDEILKRIRGSMSDSPLQRIHLTSRKDIHNIKKAFDLNAIAVEHPFDMKGDDQNIFNMKTESDGQPDTNHVIIQHTDCDNKNFEYSLKMDNSFEDIKTDGNLVVLRTEPVPYGEVEEVVDSGIIDYNALQIEHAFDLNTEEAGTYEVIESAELNPEEIESTYDVVDELTNPVLNGTETVECVYKLNIDTATPSLEVDTMDYTDSLNASVVDDTKEAVENLLKLNTTESNQFLNHESLSKWVLNLRTSQNTSLALYKPQACYDPLFPELVEDDFLLIYMTEAQKDILIKDSKDIVSLECIMCKNIQLYALLIPDETRDGFPAAFLFTNRNDYSSMLIFFEKVKEVVGALTPKAFITNEDSFYLAWMKVMGGDAVHLICSRSVLQSWRTEVTRIRLKEKRNQTYKTLQNLLFELDEANFHNLLADCTTKWKQDDSMLLFYEPFSAAYITNNQFKKWAYCFRINAGVNTNISVDSFNRILKYCNLRGDKVKLSDKTLCDILNLLRVKVFELVIKIIKGKVAKKLQNLRLRHGYSYTNDSEYVIQDEDKWQVYNYVGSEISEVYTLKKLKDCTKCLLQCQQCNSCFHEYVCSCSDHLMKNNMCKHIHLVARTQKLMENKEDGEENGMQVSLHDGDEANHQDDFGLEQISDTDLPFVLRKRHFIEDIRKCLEEKVKTVEQLEYAKRHWKPILGSLNSPKPS